MLREVWCIPHAAPLPLRGLCGVGVEVEGVLNDVLEQCTHHFIIFTTTNPSFVERGEEHIVVPPSALGAGGVGHWCVWGEGYVAFWFRAGRVVWLVLLMCRFDTVVVTSECCSVL